MWIRSQTKNALVNINFMRVIDDGNFCLICGATTDGCDYELGIYSTEEKALKVMDMIQKQIAFCSESYEIVRPVLKSDNFEPYRKKREVVFNMPEDTEI